MTIRMFPSWKLGRIAGIDVFVHPTFLIFLFFLLPEAMQQDSTLAVIVMLCASMLSLALVFGCVLLHEFGHALMARRFGIETEDITLYPIGGVARLRRLPRAPGVELLIALAGPAVNFAIIGVLLALWSLGFNEVLTGSVLGALAGRLLFANVVLGLFNLIPAFPMDGGRVLRALLTGVMGRAQATSIAAGIGRVLAVVFGISSFFWSPYPLIQVALAAFIFLAARAEEMQVLHEERHRRFAAQSEGVWVAPPGYRWVQQGNGVWQLAPIVVPYHDPYQRASSWR
jgi:Zn-dependent protease